MQLNIDSYADFKSAVAQFGVAAPIFYRFAGPLNTTLLVSAICGNVVIKGQDDVSPPTSSQFLNDFPAATLMISGFDLSA